MQVAVGAAVEDGHDVGMVEGGGGAGLPAEPGHQLKVIGRGCGEHLDRYGALQHPVAGPIHLAHAPGPHHCAEGVPATQHPSLQRHRRRPATVAGAPGQLVGTLLQRCTTSPGSLPGRPHPPGPATLGRCLRRPGPARRPPSSTDSSWEASSTGSRRVSLISWPRGVTSLRRSSANSAPAVGSRVSFPPGETGLPGDSCCPPAFTALGSSMALTWAATAARLGSPAWRMDAAASSAAPSSSHKRHPPCPRLRLSWIVWPDGARDQARQRYRCPPPGRQLDRSRRSPPNVVPEPRRGACPGRRP
jgi:hypothetical protein